jgi:hypothetical protein
MGRTHDVSISGFDLDRIEASARYWKKKADELEQALNEARQEIARLHMELRLKDQDCSVTFRTVGWGNPQTLIEQNPPKGVLSNATPQAQQPTKQQTNL